MSTQGNDRDSGASDELSELCRSLGAQRAHVLQAVEGLPEKALHSAVLPSGWSCLGLIQHLTLDVERFWFRAVIAGEAVTLQSGDGGWRVASDTPSADILESYREETALADAVIMGTDLEALAAWWPITVFHDLPVRSLRRVLLHVITETACHAGHLDAAREVLDGRQHLVLT